MKSLVLFASIFSLGESLQAKELTLNAGPASNSSLTVKKTDSIKRVFLNASKNRNGNTVDYAKTLLNGLEYSTVNLIDFHIDQIGQETKEDEYAKVINLLREADVIVIGTPVYWSDMSGYLKTFIDRLNDIVTEDLKSQNAPLSGADVYLIIQGSDPKDAIPGITTVIKHISKRFFMNYKGTILKKDEALKINAALRK